MRLWLRVWLVVGTGCLVLVWFQYAQYKSSYERISRTVQQVNHLVAVQAEVSTLEVAIGKLQGKIARIAELLPPDEILAVCQQTASSVRSTVDAIQLTEMKVVPVTATVTNHRDEKRNENKAVELQSTVILSGLAIDDKAISQLILELRRMPLFSAITLKSSSHIVLPNGHARQFQIVCDY